MNPIFLDIRNSAALLLALVLASPLAAQDRTVLPGDTICGGYVIPDTAAVGTRYRCDVRGPDDFRRVAASVGVLTVGGAPSVPVKPVAAWGYSCVDRRCAFDGSPSSGAVAWAWYLPSGVLWQTSPTFTHQFQGTASGTVTLVVTSKDGLSDTLAKLVSVVADTAPPPPADTTPRPPPDTTPAPPPDTTPTPPPTNDWVTVFSDDFETGRLSAAQNGYRWGASNTGPGDALGVTSTRARSGRFALEFTFAGGGSADDAWSEQRFTLGAPLQAVALDYWVYFPRDFTVRSVSPDNNKFLRLWDDDYNRFKIKLGYSMTASRGVIAEAGGAFGAVGPNYPGLEPWRGDFPRDRWVHVRAEVTIGRTGVMDLYVDGQRVSRSERDLSGPYLRNGYLMGWANSGFAATSDMSIDDFTIQVRN